MSDNLPAPAPKKPTVEEAPQRWLRKAWNSGSAGRPGFFELLFHYLEARLLVRERAKRERNCAKGQHYDSKHQIVRRVNVVQESAVKQHVGTKYTVKYTCEYCGRVTFETLRDFEL